MTRISKQPILVLILVVSISCFTPTTWAAPEQPTPVPTESEQSPQLSEEDIQRFSTAISYIKRYYVKPVSDKVLFDNAIRGMLAGLDPHSSYLDEQEFAELQTTTKGEFGGVGIEVTVENGLLKVISPIDNGPAQKAGIKAGDYIVQLDTQSARNMSLQEAVNTMRGKKGSNIELVIMRKEEAKPLHFKITRDIIHIQSVKSRLLDKKYAYVRVSFFQEPTVNDFEKAITKLTKDSGNQLQGMILDLRDNPGGLLDSAIQLSNMLIQSKGKDKEELIVYTEGRIPGSKFKAYATSNDILKNAPIIVLINEGSASASEIVAGALKDDKRAIVMGTKSFGKGSVQTVLPLDDKRGIKLTTALYYTPSGRSIQAEGVTPDIIVENIKIPTSEKNKENTLSESQLKNHLANGNQQKNTTEKSSTEKDNAIDKGKDATITEDYQLHQALNLLKAITIMQEAKRSS